MLIPVLRSPIVSRRAILTSLLISSSLAGCVSNQPYDQLQAAATTYQGSRVPEQLSPDLYPKGAQAAPEPVVRYGRYTLVSTEPKADQRDLMSQIVDVTIPDTLSPNVRDAMNYVLKRSGYGLCAGTGNINILYTRPLPASQYHLGPMTLRNTLQILAGPAWQVQVDEVTRGVCFVQRPGYEHPTTPVVNKVPASSGSSSVSSYALPSSTSIHKGGTNE